MAIEIENPLLGEKQPDLLTVLDAADIQNIKWNQKLFAAGKSVISGTMTDYPTGQFGYSGIELEDIDLPDTIIVFNNPKFKKAKNIICKEIIVQSDKASLFSTGKLYVENCEIINGVYTQNLKELHVTNSKIAGAMYNDNTSYNFALFTENSLLSFDMQKSDIKAMQRASKRQPI